MDTTTSFIQLLILQDQDAKRLKAVLPSFDFYWTTAQRWTLEHRQVVQLNGTSMTSFSDALMQNGATPLLCAVQRSSMPIITLLLERGAATHSDVDNVRVWVRFGRFSIPVDPD